MFVLEKLLRGLSSDQSAIEESGLIPKISVYTELIGKVNELRQSRWSKIDSEYYQRLRMLIDPYLKRAMEGIKAGTSSAFLLVEDLKIIMFAHDNKLSVPFSDEIDWTGVIKRLMDELEGNEGLMIRVLRYLKTSEVETEVLETVPLLLMNTLNKLLMTSKCNDISFVLQVLNLIEFPSGMEKNLLLLLRRPGVNDRLKSMAVRILLTKMDVVDEGDIMRMLPLTDGEKVSAVISAELKGDRQQRENVPVSSSKVVNYFNGHYESFSEVEKYILVSGNTKNISHSNGYERFLLALSGEDLDDDYRSDPNVLKELFRQRRTNLSTEMFIEKLGDDDLGTEDYVMIACRCHEDVKVDLFWKYMNRIPFVTEKIEALEAKRELFIRIDHKNSSVVAQYYFSKILKEFRGLDDNEYKEEECTAYI